MKTLREPRYTKYWRVWRTLWFAKDNLLMTSTYGEVKSYKFETNEEWEEIDLMGHSHSVFGIDSINSKYIVTGDYRGNLIIWEFKDDNFETIQMLGVIGTVQDICWYNENNFAVINKAGKIYLIESAGKEEKQWQVAVEVDVANTNGVCIEITDDGETVFAGTSAEIIQFDRSSQQAETTFTRNLSRIYTFREQIYYLNKQGLYAFERRPVEIKKELINYRFNKISLLGHTGTGKTTFCNGLIYGDIDNIYSTFGKKILNWELNGDGSKKRIIFHDHGGQETVLDTFIPFLKDSDIIMIFYKQTDKTTFDRALEILDEIQEKIGDSIKIYLTQTFVDHKLNEIPEDIAMRLIKDKRIFDIIKMSPKEKIGFDEFKEKILDKIDWDNSRIMIQSPYIDGISKTFAIIHEKDYPVIAFDEFKWIYQDTINQTISARHLKFLLEDYTNQGIIEYYPNISNLIIFNDDTFNKMRTEIPILVDHLDGIVSIDYLKEKFDIEELLEILDEMYLQSRIAIKNGDLRIFPHKLSEKPIKIPEEYKEDLIKEESLDIYVNFQKIEIDRLIELLSELNLQCIDVTKNEGLFAWEKNAYVYYFMQEDRRGIFERYIKFVYTIGGNKQRTKERLEKEFSTIIERLYGPVIDIEKKENKKNLTKSMNLTLLCPLQENNENMLNK